MAQIHILDSETIDKIAAGEVVERPSSVVKELVENAIDAGAGAVTVEVKGGGIEFIRVTDNGCGMEGSQLRRAFLRHATSKIEDAEDLTRISSLGFRGEALSSIAAVAKVEVITKTADSMTGCRIALEGAKETGFEEVGAPEGTTFLVRNLFFNTPVRRKFLKQPVTEGGYIVDLMEHLALSRPDISFKLIVGGQMKFHTSGNGDLKEVIYRIYGRDAANELVPVQVQGTGVRVEGYLGKPVQVRSNRNFEIYFINGRFIRSNVVSRAVEEGYKEYLMQHKFPFCVLHITMDAGRVDVNVHPTKMDVRFDDAIGFSSFLMEAVREALRSREMIPQASLSTERELREARKEEKKAERSAPGKQSAPEPFEHRRGRDFRVMEEARYDAGRPKAREFARNPVWERVKGSSAAGAEGGTEPAEFSQTKETGMGAVTPRESMETASPEEGKTAAADSGNLAGANPTEPAWAAAMAATGPMAERRLAPMAETGLIAEKRPAAMAETGPIAERRPAPMAATGPIAERRLAPMAAGAEGGTEPAEFSQTIETGMAAVTATESIDTAPLEEEELFFTETSELPEEPVEEEHPTENPLSGSALTDAGTSAFPSAAAAQPDEPFRPSPAGNAAPLPGYPSADQPETYSGEQMNLFEERILTLENRSRFRIIGQVFDTYWLIEFEDKLMMIDQHAAHEKVNYERLMKRYREKNVLSQGLMPPVIVSLSGQEEAVLKEHLDTFAALGFEIEAFGGSEYALRSVPVDLYGCDEREMFLEALDSLLDGTGFGSIRVIEEKIASMSCKAAVKGNNKISVPEAETLIDELLTLDNPYNCPHGRPTIVTMTKAEMERKFKRIVN
nr:DNA mismatch repair endonuclease MutL [uncultured Acetatifactor sp.]